MPAGLALQSFGGELPVTSGNGASTGGVRTLARGRNDDGYVLNRERWGGGVQGEGGLFVSPRRRTGREPDGELRNPHHE